MSLMIIVFCWNSTLKDVQAVPVEVGVMEGRDVFDAEVCGYLEQADGLGVQTGREDDIAFIGESDEPLVKQQVIPGFQ